MAGVVLVGQEQRDDGVDWTGRGEQACLHGGLRRRADRRAADRLGTGTHGGDAGDDRRPRRHDQRRDRQGDDLDPPAAAVRVSRDGPVGVSALPDIEARTASFA
jgi:hypothetical protein